ncbi:hypothetical protein F8B91_16705 [Aestuariivirga litoralis]|nr:hypothetical protein [Aestuariivirga litoralis]
MNWKAQLRVSDLDLQERLEVTCRRCGHVHFLTPFVILRQGKELGFLHLDEVEARTRCKARGCGGRVRLAKRRPGETSGFVGGMP